MSERQYVVDRLRGFALLGVLIVNTPFLITSVVGISPASLPTIGDEIAGFVTWTFFQAKSYVVFSFLFGYSLSILLDSLARRGHDATRIYRQRLMALGLFGTIHACLLFVGDILVPYAILGVALIWLRHRPDRSLLRIAAALGVGQILLLSALLLVPVDESAGGLGAGVSIDVIDQSWASDGILAATVTRAQVWPFALALIVILQGLLVAALFCIGLVAGRRQLLARPDQRLAAWRRVRAWGWGLGLPIQLVAGTLATWPGVFGLNFGTGQAIALILMYPTAPILSAGYVATIVLLPRRGLSRWVEADGQMSLSVYLAESLVMTTLAAGWGVGLFGLSTGSALAVAVAVWLTLVGGASLWRRRLGQGPAERLLRRLTYAGQEVRR